MTLERSALLLHHEHIRRLQVAVNHAFLVRVLHRAAHRKEQFQPLMNCHPLRIAVPLMGTPSTYSMTK